MDLDKLPGLRQIGKILVSSKVLGMGSSGATIYEGSYEKRPAAVKRLVLGHYDVAYNEVKNLIATDRDPTVVRYYGTEEDVNFVYLAIERCDCSLDDFIKAYSPSSNLKLDAFMATPNINLWRADGRPSTLLLKLMR